MSEAALFHKLAAEDTSDVGYDLSVELGDDPDEWIPEILVHVLTKHPYLADSLASPEFEVLDETAQSARGSIIARTGEAVIQIPIIVNEGRLCPVDVFLYQGKPYPLTERRISTVFFSPEMGEALVAPSARMTSRRDEGGLDEGVRELGGGDEFDDLAGGYKTGSLRDFMARASVEAKECLARDLTENPAVFEALKGSCHGLLNHIFSDPKVAEVEEAPVCAVQVEATGPGPYRVASWRVGGLPEEQKCAGAGAAETLAELGADVVLLDRADQEGVVTVSLKESPVANDKTMVSQLGKVDKPGAHTVYSSTLAATTAYVFPSLRSLGGGTIDKALVLPEEGGCHGLQAQVAGETYSKGCHGVLERVAPNRQWSAKVLRGRMIVIVGSAKERDPETGAMAEQAFAYEPVLVQQMIQRKSKDHEGDVACIQGMSGARQVCLLTSSGIPTVTKIDRDKATPEVRRMIPPRTEAYAIPEGWRIATVNPSIQSFLSESAQVNAAVKVAAEMELGSVRIWRANGLFDLCGGAIDEFPEDAKVAELTEKEARLTLAALGYPEVQAQSLLDETLSTGTTRAYGLMGHCKLSMKLPLPTVTPAIKGVSKDPLGAIANKASAKITGAEMSKSVGSMPPVVRKLQKNGAKLANLAAILAQAYGLSLDGGGAMEDQGEDPYGGYDFTQPPEEPMANEWDMETPEASVEEGAESLLGMSFLNRDNIKFFAAQAPLFQKVTSLLAQMLLALRVRPERAFIEEATVREALNYMEDVLEELEGIAD